MLFVLAHAKLYIYSEGCASAVKRILGKVDGVTSVETNVSENTVVVDHEESVSKSVMLQKLRVVS